MGIFNFVKDAGSKIFGKKEGSGAKLDAATQEQLDEGVKANALWHAVTKLGFEVEELHILFDDGVATVRGKTPNQAEKEKVILAIGNTEGVARVDDRIEVVEPEPEAAFYTVVSGDTLSKIAQEHYGDAGKYPVIFEANKPMLQDPDKIYPGQVLRIPPE